MVLGIIGTICLVIVGFDALLACPDGRSKAFSLAASVAVLAAIWLR